jgi:hypothetical protein
VVRTSQERKVYRLGGCLLCVVGCAAPKPVSVAPAVPALLPLEAPVVCDVTAERRDAEARLARGEWFAALRRIRAADASCPASSGQSAAHLRTLLARLAAGGATPGALLDAAREAELRGATAEARLLQDRAAFALERPTGAAVTPSVPLAGRDEAQSFWSPDSQWLLTRNRDGLALRRRDEWYPRYYSPSHHNGGDDTSAVVSEDGTTLLSFERDVVHGVSPSSAQRWLSIVDVRPGESFAEERARFAIPGGADPALAGPGHVAFLEQAPAGGARVRLSVASLRTGQIERQVEPAESLGRVTRFAVSPEGRHALLQVGDQLGVVDLTTGVADYVHAPNVTPSSEHFSPDERYAIWSDRDGAARRLVIHDLKSGKSRYVLPPPCELSQGFVFDESSTRLAIGDAKPRACLVELATGKVRTLRLSARDEYVRPAEFLANDRALWLVGSSGGVLLDVLGGRELTRIEEALGLLYVDEKPTLISMRGTFTVVESELGLRSVDPQPRAVTGAAWTATRIRRELAMRFESGWLIADTVTGKTRSLDMPADAIPEVAEDDSYLATTNGRTPELFAVASGSRAKNSPVVLAGADLDAIGKGSFTVRTRRREWQLKRSDLGLRRELKPESFGERCFGATMVEPSKRFGLMGAADEPQAFATVDCASGARGAAFKIDGSASALASPTRVVGQHYERPDSYLIWDAHDGALVASVSVGPGQYLTRSALSADDRFLLLNNTVWSVRSSTRVSEIPPSYGKAGFVAPDLLLVDQQGRLDFYRAPGFERVASLVFTSDLAGAALFALTATGGVSALEILGEGRAFDSTLPCGVGGQGVPFRVCREALERPGLLNGLLD